MASANPHAENTHNNALPNCSRRGPYRLQGVWPGNNQWQGSARLNQGMCVHVYVLMVVGCQWQGSAHLEPGHVRQHAQSEAGAEVLDPDEARQLAEVVRGAG